MDKEIQVVHNQLPGSTVPQTAFTQSGDNGVQIANSGTVNLVTQYFLPHNGPVINTGNTVNFEYYNLFVVGGETFEVPFFLVPKDRALTVQEGVAEEIHNQLAALTPEAIAEIKRFPSLFASENHHYGHTDPDHLALFGFVTDVKIQENSIKIYFQKCSCFQQQRLNEIAHRLEIRGKPSFNELCRTHWTIKKINVVEELKAAGISVLVPT